MTQTSQEQLDEEPGLAQRAWKTKNNGSIVQSCVNNACKNTGARGTRHDHYTIVESVETLFTVEPLIYQASLTNQIIGKHRWKDGHRGLLVT